MVSRRSVAPGQPRLRHNDYTPLAVPPLGQWRPSLTVSVVVPAYNGQDRLDLVLAALAGQSYPGDLLEVVVVDDGSEPPLRLAELRPEHARVVRAAADRWGPAHAVHTGVEASAGEVVLRLDSDIVAHREHVEAHLLWHHLADYMVVMGRVMFTPFVEGELTVEDVYKAVHQGAAASLFDADNAVPNWTARVIEETNGLRDPHCRPFRVATGATVSWRRPLYHAAGGMDRALLLGSDTEFGYRLGQAGAVFVPESKALGWHLGMSQMKTRPGEGGRYRSAHLSHRIPSYRHWRQSPGRHWQTPFVDVVVDATTGGYEQVSATVSGALASTLPDVEVTIVGPWSQLPEPDRAVLDDPRLDLRLLRAAFGSDGRVRLRETVEPTSAPAPFRLRCPVGLVPTADALRRLTELADQQVLGLVQLAVPTGDGLAVARLERTAAMARARRVAGHGEELDEVIDEVYGSYWLDGTEWAFATADDMPAALPMPKLLAEHDRWRDLARHRGEELARRDEEIARLRHQLAGRGWRARLSRAAGRELRGR